MAFGDEEVAVGCDDDAARLGERVRRVAGDARCSDRHEDFAVRVELHHGMARRSCVGIFQLLPRVHRAHVDHPDIAIAVDVDLVREDEQARAEALQDISIGIELVHRRPARAGAAVVLEGRFARRDVGVRAAAVHYPDRAAVVVDRDAVERAPFAVIGGQVAPW